MSGSGGKRLLLIGSPNVGKSVIFNALTGAYAAVSNYPGTTVEIATGICQIEGQSYEVIDTPGLYSLLPVTEEERVTRRILFARKATLVLHVLDAKNIRRMLPLSFELLDGGFPVILVLNMMDEAWSQGLTFDMEKLAAELEVPVIALSAIKQQGMDQLKRLIGGYQVKQGKTMLFSSEVEETLANIARILPDHPVLNRRLISYLLLQQDKEILGVYSFSKQLKSVWPAVQNQREYLQEKMGPAFSQQLMTQRQQYANQLVHKVLSISQVRHVERIARGLGRMTRQPLTGIPILCLVLYFGLYQLVGHFGAGFLVDYLDEEVFQRYLIPLAQDVLSIVNVSPLIQSVFIGEYGLFTLGIRYAAVIVLPIVGSFFLVFAFLEDCGYLPRLALLTDGLFRRMGLNGRAVIPMMLGLGCGTMAVMATRTLESKRERLLATFLLALTIPCSAQLGIVLAILSHHMGFLSLWCVYLLGVFIVSGYVSDKVLPGKRRPFFMELPPFRCPRISNVVMKAYTRMMWYFSEILPVFLLISFLLWLSDFMELLPQLIAAVIPIMNLLGLPPEAAKAFLMGFIRRDYGAAGMYDLYLAGQLSDSELFVACITFTLFMPCLAQFMVMLKERGILATLAIVSVILVVSIGSGGLIHWLLL
jgi:ferrous iron transport protein B